MAPVVADRNQLEMALLNLAVNARDAMPEGGTITVAAREERLDDANIHRLPAGRYAVLSVIDRGTGMDAETLRRAIDPFFTTKGVGKGTGLGLSMVHGLAIQSGGLVDLKSELGQGTTASLWIPVPEGGAMAATAAAEESAVPAGRRQLAILAVDDDGLVLLNTAAMLEDEGHAVTTAVSGKDALHALKSGMRFDLMITDQGMPGMSGLELIEEARRQQPGLAVLLATGYAELPEGGGALPRLAKPFTQRQLLGAVAGVVGR